MKIICLNLRNLALLIVLFVFSAKFVVAQEVKTEKSLLWEVSGNGLEKPSFLFGTIHIICEDEMVWSADIDAALGSAEKIVLELDMDDPKEMQGMQQLVMNPGMSNFSDKLSEEDKSTLNTFFTDNYGMGMKQLGIMKPFALMSMVMPKYLECARPGSYEGKLVQLAKAQEKEILGLESAAFQTGIFDNLPFEKQVELLMTTVEDFDKGKEDFAKMVGTYRAQDLNALYNMIKESPEYAELTEEMLDKRNMNWIPKLEEMMKAQSVFIAVGVGHLASEKGVINLLREQGYTLKPLMAQQ